MGRKLALLVGVSEYGDTLSPLPCAARDVSALAAVLRATQRGGFDTVHELVNPSNDTLQISVESFFRGGQSDDLLLLYFSGHAVKDTRGDLFFATPQTRRSPNGDLQRATATRCSFVHECMDDSRSRRQVIILDCCFSGAFAEGLAAKDDRAIDIQQNFGGEGRAILTSSTSTQYSYARSNSELSEYTGHLVEGIRTGRADLDSDGMISTDELHEYAQKEIRANQHTSGMKPKIFPVREGYKIFVSQAPLVDARTAYCAELRRVG
ncbi:MAG: caspase family protein, partial [Myxococcales bacterium]|nr:caspase family protein [Myxococcales bacterium]